MHKQIGLLIFGMMCVACLAFGQGADTARGTLDPRLVQADKLYTERADLTKVKFAIGLASDVMKSDPQSFEAASRLAEYYYFIGKRSPQGQQLDLFQRGIDFAKKAVELKPNEAAGYFWLATNQGLYGETKGLFSSMGMRKEIRANFEKAAQLDGGYYGGGPWRGLGRWDYRVPGLMGGDKKRSVEELEKALKIAPGNSLTKLYLAETYLDNGRKDDAKTQLNEILTMQPDPRWDVEHKENIQEAKKLLDKYFKK
ncbi:MAG: tetratricopeptide repeat protein [Acidobacteriia bacterium]|nr:tetratricopeptide repeat protein [Terriglobia bacterium]